MGRVALVCAAAIALAACGSSRPPAKLSMPADFPADTLTVAPEATVSGHKDLVVRAQWHLLRAQEARLCSLFTTAQIELDEALHLLAAMDPDLGQDTLLQAMAHRVEDEYLRLLPQLERLSPDSPLTLLLQGLSEERVQDLSPDDSQMIRIHQAAQSCDMPIDVNARVAASVHFFQTRGRATMEAWMQRAGLYRDMIVAILGEAGLPEDLLYLAMIESGFNPHAFSRARAVGIWQFMVHTGRLEGLQQTHWIDERRDPVKSTRAAANHLRYLYAQLDDWRLALAAYNAGLGRVRRAIDRDGTRNYWELGLPRETRNYVPLFMAATVINRNPELFGFAPPEPETPVAYDEVVIPRDVPYIDLRVAADIMGQSYATLRQLNPELRQRITPPGEAGRGYRLRVPAGHGTTFLERYAALPPSARPELYEYVVQTRDNLSSIARAFGVSSRLIAEANSITNPNRIYPGQRLYVPGAAGVRGTAAGNRTEHTVRAGESLSRIAQRYGVRVSDLRTWNGLGSTVIHPGDKLVVVEQRATVETRARPSTAPQVTGDQRYQGDGQYHIVAPGETLWELSRHYGISVTELQRWNQITDTLIRPGQRLLIARGTGGQEETYTVVRGDTLYSVARRFGVRARDLARHNNMSTSSTLLAGTRLRIMPAADTE